MENRPTRGKKYLTIEMFEKFLNNHFYHLKREVRVILWINGTLLGGLVLWALVDRLLS